MDLNNKLKKKKIIKVVELEEERSSIAHQLQLSLARADSEALARAIAEETVAELEKEKTMKELEIKGERTVHFGFIWSDRWLFNGTFGCCRHCGPASGGDHQQGGGAQRPSGARERAEGHVRAPHPAEWRTHHQAEDGAGGAADGIDDVRRRGISFDLVGTEVLSYFTINLRYEMRHDLVSTVECHWRSMVNFFF